MLLPLTFHILMTHQDFCQQPPFVLALCLICNTICGNLLLLQQDSGLKLQESFHHFFLATSVYLASAFKSTH